MLIKVGAGQFGEIADREVNFTGAQRCIESLATQAIGGDINSRCVLLQMLEDLRQQHELTHVRHVQPERPPRLRGRERRGHEDIGANALENAVQRFGQALATRRGLEPGSRAEVLADVTEVTMTEVNEMEWHVLMALKREFAPEELHRFFRR